jgi:hypothetical protein
MCWGNLTFCCKFFQATAMIAKRGKMRRKASSLLVYYVQYVADRIPINFNRLKHTVHIKNWTKYSESVNEAKKISGRVKQIFRTQEKWSLPSDKIWLEKLFQNTYTSLGYNVANSLLCTEFLILNTVEFLNIYPP